MKKESVPLLVVMVGVPGSGKSTYAASQKGFTVHSSDGIRKELFGNIYNQQDNITVFAECYRRIKNSLLNGDNVIYDATNISIRSRKELLAALKGVDFVAAAVWLDRPYSVCLDWNKKRKATVPPGIVAKMYRTLTAPERKEGFYQIIRITGDGSDYSSLTSCSALISFIRKNRRNQNPEGEKKELEGGKQEPEWKSVLER